MNKKEFGVVRDIMAAINDIDYDKIKAEVPYGKESVEVIISFSRINE